MYTAAVLVVLTVASTNSPARSPDSRGPVESFKVTVLSTMLAGDPLFKGVGEWGYAALVEADGRRILFDTGARPELVLRNAEELGIDLSDVTDVVITHNHWDHVGGLLVLRRELSKKNPAAISRVHVSEGIFLRRPEPDGSEGNGILPLKEAYEATGGTFVVHSGPAELLPGVWFTGPIPRIHPEFNYGRSWRVETPAGLVEDDVPEDSAIAIDTAEGLIVLTGCGHAGIINTLEHASRVIRRTPIHAAIGGLHLLGADDEALRWTAAKLREFGLQHLLAGHCTGLEATYRLREYVGLDRRRAVVSAVGSAFTLREGITPLLIAR